MPSPGNNITLNQVGVSSRRYNPNQSTSLIGAGGSSTQTSISDLVTDKLYTYLSSENHTSQSHFHSRNGWNPGRNRKKGGDRHPGAARLEFNLYYPQNNNTGNTYFNVWAHYKSGGKWAESDGPGSRTENWSWWTDQPKYLKCVWNGGSRTQWRMRGWTTPGGSRNARIYARYNDRGGSDHASRYGYVLYSPQFKMIGQSVPGIQLYTRGEGKYYRHHSYPHYYGSHNDGYVRLRVIQGRNPKSRTYQCYLNGYGYRYATTGAGRDSYSNYIYWYNINAGGHYQYSAGWGGYGGTGRWINGWIRPTDNNDLIRYFSAFVYFGHGGYGYNQSGKNWSNTYNPINP